MKCKRIMKCKRVYVVLSPISIFGIYEEKEMAIKHFDSLKDVIDGIRISVEFVIPGLPF